MIKGYPYSPHGDNNSPPNPADQVKLCAIVILDWCVNGSQVNPAQSVYFKESISRGCTPNNAYPFSYRPHYAQYVDPETGNVSKIIVVPAAMVNDHP